MAKIWLYIFIFIGMAILPLSIMNRAAPQITREKAMKAVANERAFSVFMLKNFWLFYPINTIVSSVALIVFIDGWNRYKLTIKVSLAVIFSITILFSAVAASMPAYVMVKRWKR